MTQTAFEDHELLALLDLETLDTDLFRGFNPPFETRRIYGGQVVAQSLAAAYRTIEDWVCHSLHCYFIRPGDPKIPILFQVDRARDGGSFSVRRVVAIQNGKQIFNLAASFQVPETGFEHQLPVPDAPPPEALKNEEELRAEAGLDPSTRRIWPVELKPCEPVPHGFVGAREPVDMCWFRTRLPLGDDVAVNQCALAYGSDMTLMDASLRPHGVDWDSGRLQAASLDHAMWFHQATDFHDWHLFVQDSPSASGGRGFNRGQIYARDGRLVAEAAQEALIRWR
ncbi:acyl-CoA thioesterase II [Phenylobacterium sp.]|uniref:acyl-CoA thioesterase n=1 Tax=Phenylobacterium sp. TaxID=1871053 RepID=UPI0025F4E205|nr:acyl-CoA thioesterase II [Phenylobacterium sp.]MCA6285277.1 acyl-CoA thioesterase II [Phenylobacterium sp.]MCA6288398.1 acyl-CoA thioesterase II [Phenylobacterium sp.]MCA6309577.1 acyl-CoA thioesterase II [Phenylobacterium sp.]MCA6323022.1 acyl-CoA thioesterase II [Phenylobacterium sp.]MCA6337554.1 acyl-CoA thioesterase II [Phenylobacterium sp.]